MIFINNPSSIYKLYNWFKAQFMAFLFDFLSDGWIHVHLYSKNLEHDLNQNLCHMTSTIKPYCYLGFTTVTKAVIAPVTWGGVNYVTPCHGPVRLSKSLFLSDFSFIFPFFFTFPLFFSLVTKCIQTYKIDP